MRDSHNHEEICYVLHLQILLIRTFIDFRYSAYIPILCHRKGSDVTGYSLMYNISKSNSSRRNKAHYRKSTIKTLREGKTTRYIHTYTEKNKIQPAAAAACVAAFSRLCVQFAFSATFFIQYIYATILYTSKRRAPMQSPRRSLTTTLVYKTF